MTAHQCPKCELRFNWVTEVDDHCRRDHPEFTHEYPAVHHDPPPTEPLLPPHAVAQPEHRKHLGASQLVAWALPKHADHQPDHHSDR